MVLGSDIRTSYSQKVLDYALEDERCDKDFAERMQGVVDQCNHRRQFSMVLGCLLGVIITGPLVLLFPATSIVSVVFFVSMPAGWFAVHRWWFENPTRVLVTQLQSEVLDDERKRQTADSIIESGHRWDGSKQDFLDQIVAARGSKSDIVRLAEMLVGAPSPA